METKSDNFTDGEHLEAKEYCSSRSGDAVEEDNNEEETEVIKRQISSHSLYDLLVDTHFDCLKVCSGISEIDKIERAETKAKYKKRSSHTMDQSKLNNNFAVDEKLSSLTIHQPELDTFMEAYCVALSKLKEAIEEPHIESIKFINHMYSQLSDLMEVPSVSTLSPTASFEGMKTHGNT
ncbi:PREDICTED: homeobox protein knotted-1-like 1 [Nicotiana attenuata]|uniref:Homeobox protein knotted-1-like 1 n=1 Tax=Nicotiana attenuata TaxID=49451 RepID=A0A314LD73_NICAT|nr:PREDICTED: homeobox protein knotted-1-like 1 [Nicotiana attenuata]OIT39595.1 hypothetical protein A4A49_19707 [Nicotiana attenuata]